ncbi:MAG: hypothetical protein LBL45_00360 [Treponema sp.]|jgi:hypothetical protein|nr:hypothetical protein [Treponema sp.]
MEWLPAGERGGETRWFRAAKKKGDDKAALVFLTATLQSHSQSPAAPLVELFKITPEPAVVLRFSPVALLT